MALDTKKKILIDTDFNKDQLNTDNALAKISPKVTLPNLSNDVTIDKHLTVGFSFNYVLKNLLDNDAFIENYYYKTKDKISKNKERIILAFKYGDGTTVPSDPAASSDKSYDKMLERHINQYHILSEVKLSAVLQNYMNSDCSNFDLVNARRSVNSFLTSYPEMSDIRIQGNIAISNDIVVKIEYDDLSSVGKASNYILVTACNNKTSNQFKQTLNNVEGMLKRIPSLKDDIKYIYKEWLSGMKELYIYLPTSFTFYNENVGTDSPNIKLNSTFIRVCINRRHFNFYHIYHTLICGQSLPLQIHNEYESEYNDIIQPSLLRSMCISKNSLNNTDCIYSENTNLMTLYFVCYGTDAQAIRIYGD